MLHEFFGAVDGHDTSPHVELFAGFVQLFMLPDVSTMSMKYGFDAAGMSAGSVERHSGASCAVAVELVRSAPALVAALAKRAALKKSEKVCFMSGWFSATESGGAEVAGSHDRS